MSKKSNPQLVERWQRRLADYCRTKQTVAAFCRSEGVSVPSFYSWKKRFTVSASSGKSVRVASRLNPSSPAFERVNILASGSVVGLTTHPAASVIRLGQLLEIELGTYQPTVETIVSKVLQSLVGSTATSTASNGTC